MVDPQRPAFTTRWTIGNQLGPLDVADVGPLDTIRNGVHNEIEICKFMYL